MGSKKRVIVGTRGSLLALRQTMEVVDRLQASYPSTRFLLSVVKTRGDRSPEMPLDKLGLGVGVFVVEVEESLLRREIDMAVHSLKDLPSNIAPGLAIDVVTERQDPRDALVSRSGDTLGKLPRGSVVGTSSGRRAVQINAFRPDLEVQAIRGNVDTRVRKVHQGQYAAVVLAAAGLLRLGWKHYITEYLSPDLCLPAVGQGALAVEAREGDSVERMVASARHPESWAESTAERGFLRALGAGCSAPVAALAQVHGDTLEVRGMIADRDGVQIFRGSLKAKAAQAEEAGRELAQRLLAQGAQAVLSG